MIVRIIIPLIHLSGTTDGVAVRRRVIDGAGRWALTVTVRLLGRLRSRLNIAGSITVIRTIVSVYKRKKLNLRINEKSRKQKIFVHLEFA